MTFFQIFQVVSPIISILAIIVFTLAYMWVSKQNGNTKAVQDGTAISEQNIAFYKDRIAIQDEQIKGLTDRINTMSQDIGKLQGALSEKDKQIEILQGRNPETLEILKKISVALDSNNPITTNVSEYMKDGREFMKIAHEYMAVSLPILKDLQKK